MTLVLQYRGFDYVSYYNGAFEAADSLAALAQTGANAVALNLQYGIDSVNSIAYADANYTDTGNGVPILIPATPPPSLPATSRSCWPMRGLHR